MTLRVPDKLLRQIFQFIKKMNLERGIYLRSILEEGFKLDQQKRILEKYQRQELSIGEASKQLGISQWEFFDLLKQYSKMLNVEFEDIKHSTTL